MSQETCTVSQIFLWEVVTFEKCQEKKPIENDPTQNTTAIGKRRTLCQKFRQILDLWPLPKKKKLPLGDYIFCLHKQDENWYLCIFTLDCITLTSRQSILDQNLGRSAILESCILFALSRARTNIFIFEFFLERNGLEISKIALFLFLALLSLSFE